MLHKQRRVRVLKESSPSQEFLNEVKTFEDNFNPNEGDDEPLQSNVVLVTQMCPNLQKKKHTVDVFLLLMCF